MRHRVLVVAGEFRQVALRRCGACLRSQHACKLVGARGQAVSVDLEDLSQITRNFQDAAVPAITGMSGTIATVSSAIRKRMRMMPERAVTAGLDAVAKIGQLVSPNGKPPQARVARLTKYGPNAIPGD